MNESPRGHDALLSPSGALLELLESTAPRRVLHCSTEPLSALQDYCRQHGITLQEVTDNESLTQASPCDLAIVSNCLEQLGKTQGTQLLASLRNYYSPHIWLLIDTHSEWSFNDLIGLGLKRLDRFELPPRQLESYGYHIAHYNHKRSWNNPQYWANPENWGKYWW